MDRMEELERSMLRQKPEKPLSKKEERLLDVARQRSRKGGCVERRHPAVFDSLVERGLLTEDGKYIEQ
jgi:hypothetical protein